MGDADDRASPVFCFGSVSDGSNWGAVLVASLFGETRERLGVLCLAGADTADRSVGLSSSSVGLASTYQIRHQHG